MDGDSESRSANVFPFTLENINQQNIWDRNLSEDEKRQRELEWAEIGRKAAESVEFMRQREEFIAAKLAAAKAEGNQDESKEDKAKNLRSALLAKLNKSGDA